MSVRELSDVKLAVLLAVGTALGSFSAALFDTLMPDADTQKQTDVQLVELAIGILAKPMNGDAVSTAPETALRTWAVKTINHVADITFDDEAKDALIDGRTGFDTEIFKALKGSSSTFERSDVIMEPYIVLPAPSELDWEGILKKPSEDDRR